MVCFDTTFFADLFRKNAAAEQKLIKLTDQNETLTTTVMTIAELYYGAQKSKNPEKEETNIKQILNNVTILEMNVACAKKFGELLNKLEKTGQKIPDRDILIAAIAITRGETNIVTRNVKDFERIPELTIIKY
jgi:tRNA(fMet)-specific endonuclease VapC